MEHFKPRPHELLFRHELENGHDLKIDKITKLKIIVLIGMKIGS